MDVTTPLIFVSIFILGSISLFLVYKYGIKKKSYEEVLAEQRRQTSALLGSSKPTKLKEKKINKKAAKKVFYFANLQFNFFDCDCWLAEQGESCKSGEYHIRQWGYYWFRGFDFWK